MGGEMRGLAGMCVCVCVRESACGRVGDSEGNKGDENSEKGEVLRTVATPQKYSDDGQQPQVKRLLLILMRVERILLLLMRETRHPPPVERITLDVRE